MTSAQIKTLQTARRTLDLSEPQYRMILRNTGRVASSTQLSNAGFEQVMAVMEEMGFRNPASPTYWRDKADGGGGYRSSASSAERMRFKVEALARECPTYPLGAMVHRLSGRRTDVLAELDNRELWNLIEAYKDILARQGRASRQGNLFEPTPAAEGSAPAGAVREGPARRPATATDGDRQGRGRNATAEPAARTRKTPATNSPRDAVGGVQPDDDDIPF